MKISMLQVDIRKKMLAQKRWALGLVLLMIQYGYVAAQQAPAASADFRQVAINMKKQYADVIDLHIVMSIGVYDKASLNEPYYRMTAEIKKSKDNYLYLFEGQHMLMSDKYLIVVDENEKEISVSARNREGEQIVQNPLIANLDSVLSFYGTPTYVGKSGDAQHFRLSYDEGLITEIDLHINTVRNIIQKIEYHYDGDQLVVIDFKTFDPRPQFSSDTFDELNYISITGSTIKPSKLFSNYHIVNADTENDPD